MRGFVRGFVWWVSVFAHNWIAHPLIPFAEMADAFSRFVGWLHDSTAVGFEAPPSTSEVAPVFESVQLAGPVDSTSTTLHLRGRIRYREPRSPAESPAEATDPPTPEWSTPAVRVGWVPPGPASTAEVAPPSGWDEPWSGPAEPAPRMPRPADGTPPDFPGTPVDLREWLEPGGDSDVRTVPLPNDTGEAPDGPIGGASGWRR